MTSFSKYPDLQYMYCLSYFLNDDVAGRQLYVICSNIYNEYHPQTPVLASYLHPTVQVVLAAGASATRSFGSNLPVRWDGLGMCQTRESEEPKTLSGGSPKERFCVSLVRSLF